MHWDLCIVSSALELLHWDRPGRHEVLDALQLALPINKTLVYYRVTSGTDCDVVAFHGCRAGQRAELHGPRGGIDGARTKPDQHAADPGPDVQNESHGSFRAERAAPVVDDVCDQPGDGLEFQFADRPKLRSRAVDGFYEHGRNNWQLSVAVA